MNTEQIYSCTYVIKDRHRSYNIRWQLKLFVKDLHVKLFSHPVLLIEFNVVYVTKY
jgi:hypothetical protein